MLIGLSSQAPVQANYFKRAGKNARISPIYLTNADDLKELNRFYDALAQNSIELFTASATDKGSTKVIFTNHLVAKRLEKHLSVYLEAQLNNGEIAFIAQA